MTPNGAGTLPVPNVWTRRSAVFSTVTSARRVILAIAVIVIALSANATVAGATRSSAPALELGNACTMVPDKKIEKAFGAPILDREVFLAKHSCTYTLGTDPAAPVGKFVAFQISPDPFASNSARFVINDQNSIEVLSEHVVTEVFDVGKFAYFNDTLQKIAVLASSKFAFELAWRPLPAGTPLDDQAKAELEKLAKLVVKRSKRAKD